MRSRFFTIRHPEAIPCPKLIIVLVLVSHVFMCSNANAIDKTKHTKITDTQDIQGPDGTQLRTLPATASSAYPAGHEYLESEQLPRAIMQCQHVWSK